MSAASATNVLADTIPDPAAHDDYMNTDELAAALHCSRRHARRVADGLDAVFDGRRKLVPRQSVTEHLEAQRAAC
jgi:hypothetical protein